MVLWELSYPSKEADDTVMPVKNIITLIDDNTGKLGLELVPESEQGRGRGRQTRPRVQGAGASVRGR